jgi:hypothetical protein
MLELLIVVVRALTLALRGDRELILEKPRAAATTGGLPPNDAIPLPGTRPTFLGCPRAKLAFLTQEVQCAADRMLAEPSARWIL